MASSSAFPSPCSILDLDLMNEIVEHEQLELSPAAATALLLETLNSSPKRSLDLDAPCSPNKKVKCVEDEDASDKPPPPRYPRHMKRKPVVLELNECVPGGIVSFLSSRKKSKRDFLVRFNGEHVPVTSLLGKHLLICAFLLPLPTDSAEADICRSMIASYPKLANLHNFEMVMVARMRDRSDFSSKEDEEAAFNHFFSAFPCLAVPFSDSRSHDFICRSLNLKSADDFVASVAVDDKEVVLRLDTDFIFRGGALTFPFTMERFVALRAKHEEWKFRLDPVTLSDDEIDQVRGTRSPPSLAELLGCQPSDLLWKCTAAWEGKICGGAYPQNLVIKCCPRDESVVRKCRGGKEKVLRKCSGGASNEKVVRKSSVRDESVLRKCSHRGDGSNKVVDDEVVSVLDLSVKKLVGLYLCIDGQFMAQLHEVHQQCLDRGLEFEVVLVFLPFFGDFTTFFHEVKLAIEKIGISSWWVAPYSDESSRWLWRLCDFSWSDKLIILDAASMAGDLEGRGVISGFGGVEAYPFTKQSLVEKKLSRLRSITLESLFDESAEGVHNIVFHGQGGPRCASHVSELKGKNVLIYFDYYGSLSCCDTGGGRGRGGVYGMVKQWYDRIKNAYPNCEVVFVPLDACSNCFERAPEMPWMSLHESAAPGVIERVFCDGGSQGSGVVAFSEDGLLRCRRAQQHLTDGPGGSIDSLFADCLREEIVDDVVDTIGDDSLTHSLSSGMDSCVSPTYLSVSI